MLKHWHTLISNIGTWKRGSERAVHKPLLTLMVLARAQRGEGNTVSYEEITGDLRKALIEFGPPRKSQHPELPFWYLQNDGFWVVHQAGALPGRKGKGQPTHAALLSHKATAEVPERLWADLSEHRHQIADLARDLLDEFWPATYHEDIATFLGLDLEARAGERRSGRRDPRFRADVLRAYERRCAICGFDGRLGDTTVGLEAAHIQFVQFNGPDVVENGLALCALHHKVFDRGGMSLDDDQRILVSQDLTGSGPVEYLFLRYQGRRLHGPQSGAPVPNATFAAWHRREVFHDPARR